VARALQVLVACQQHIGLQKIGSAHLWVPNCRAFTGYTYIDPDQAYQQSLPSKGFGPCRHHDSYAHVAGMFSSVSSHTAAIIRATVLAIGVSIDKPEGDPKRRVAIINDIGTVPVYSKPYPAKDS
jgi:hypothetical protein